MMARIRGGSVNSGRGTKRKQQPLTNLLLGPSETRYDRDFATNIPASQIFLGMIRESISDKEAYLSI